MYTRYTNHVRTTCGKKMFSSLPKISSVHWAITSRLSYLSCLMRRRIINQTVGRTMATKTFPTNFYGFSWFSLIWLEVEQEKKISFHKHLSLDVHDFFFLSRLSVLAMFFPSVIELNISHWKQMDRFSVTYFIFVQRKMAIHWPQRVQNANVSHEMNGHRWIRHSKWKRKQPTC